LKFINLYYFEIDIMQGASTICLKTHSTKDVSSWQNRTHSEEPNG